MPKSPRSLILLGNGPSLLDGKLGARIDAFDVVVRLNNFRIEGLETFVGTRTTIWARSLLTDIRPRDASGFERILLCAPRWVRPEHRSLVPWYGRLSIRLTHVPIDRLLREHASVDLVEDRTVAAVEAAMGITERERRWPSTGLIALGHLVERYELVHVHGFDHFAAQSGGREHAFRDRPWIRASRFHVGPRERAYVEGLIAAGRVRRLADEAG